MPLATTEDRHRHAVGLDALAPEDAARVLLEAQAEALSAVLPARPQIVAASVLMAECLRGTGTLVYAAAGSSGLMAAADAMELPGTFGIPPGRIRIEMAGGLPTLADLPGGVEDDAEDGARRGARLGSGDLAIVVTASGRTPYAVAFARAARAGGARTICIANTADAPLFDHASVAIALVTPAEPIAGSTRLGAGTAQKAALNTLSTLTGIALGGVHDGLMVNLRADNDKLRDRAARSVAAIAGTGKAEAQDLLARGRGSVRHAVLLASGARDLAEATLHLDAAQGNLRAARARLNNPADHAGEVQQ